MGGHALRKRGRDEQVAFKTTLLKRQQLERLALRLGPGKSLTDTFEAALDALEDRLDNQGQQS